MPSSSRLQVNLGRVLLICLIGFGRCDDIAGADAHIHNVPLKKQYVPVTKNNKTVAFKTAYFGNIKIGAPEQNFTVVFDTGSGHLVLPQDSCVSPACVKNRRYSAAKSTSAVLIEYDGAPIDPSASERDRVVVSYGTGKITGEFVRDHVCVGDVDPICMTMRVVLATEMTDDPFVHFQFDGVMGLSLDALRLGPQFSFFGEMIKQNPAMQPQFSVFLSRHDGEESTISFGGYNKERAIADLDWAPVAMPDLGYWQVKISEIRIGNTVLEECADGTCRAILDTGTSLLGVPRMASRSMHRLLARVAPVKENHESIDCRQVPGHPIEFVIGDVTVSLPVEDYSRPAPINMSSPENNSTSLVCRSLLLPLDMAPPIGPKVFIWGEPVLRRYLTVYDLAEKRVGFSLAKQIEPPADKEDIGTGSIGAPPAGSLVTGAPLPKSASVTDAPTPTIM